MTQQKLDHALAAAALGFNVFPLIPGEKKPLIKDWPSRATTDAGRIRQWWQETPDANIGVTGDDLIIVDVDTKDGKRGHQALMALELQHGDLPDTLTSRTPTGGKHIFLRTPRPVANSVQKIGQGLDIRGRGGYVVAPGSTIDGKEYQWERPPQETPIADAAEWLIGMAGTTRERAADAPTSVGELDTESAIQKATALLRRSAAAVQGDGGDTLTFKLAARVLDLGISTPQAVNLMLEYWNERCSPPWSYDELEAKVYNAARYRQEPIGSKNAEAEFEPVTDPEITNQKPVNREGDAPERKTPLRAKPANIPNEEDLEPYDWQWRQIAAKRYISTIVASPGVGKTNLVLAVSVAKAAGRDDIVGDVHGKGKVWFISGEDSIDDVNKRVRAIMKLHGVAKEDIDGHLFINSAQDETIRLATTDRSRQVKQVDAKAIAEQCLENGIDLLILDPLIEFHTVDENSNNEMSEVGSIARGISWDANCAVLLVHHTRKRDKASSAGQEGDPDSARGAGASAGKARFMYTLNSMTEQHAKEYGISDNDRRHYIGLHFGKSNVAPRVDVTWFRQVGVDLGSRGLQVGAIQPVDLERAPASDGTDAALMALVIDGVLATVGAGKWTPIGPIVEHVMVHDAFWRGREQSGVRKHIRRVIEAAAAAHSPSGEWTLDMMGQGTKQARYRLIPAHSDVSEGD